MMQLASCPGSLTLCKAAISVDRYEVGTVFMFLISKNVTQISLRKCSYAKQSEKKVSYCLHQRNKIQTIPQIKPTLEKTFV